MNTPFRFSVVVPCHDGLPDVLDAVDSVFAQTLPALEVILVDDASTDGAGEAVRRRYGDRVRLIAGRYGGAAAARNVGWRAAKGEWIAFLDADDLWLPEKLGTASANLADAPEADWFFSDGAFQTVDGQLHASWFGLYADVLEPWVGSPLEELLEVNFVLTSSVVVRREALEAVGGFDESLTHAEDADLWIRLSRQGLATASRRALVRYQHKEGGLTRQLERRLAGGAALFARLSRDPSLGVALRRRAKHRESVYRYKLALTALRAGRTAEARREFTKAWMFPGRAVPVALGWLATCLPTPLFNRVRRARVAKHAARPMLAPRRVCLSGRPPSGSSGAAPGAARRRA